VCVYVCVCMCVCVCVCVCVGRVELYRLLGLDDESSDPKAPWSGKP